MKALRRTWRVTAFFAYFFVLLVKSNWKLAVEVLRVTPRRAPRIMRYDVSELSRVELVVLASAITLTPGTLSMDISSDNRTLYMHGMFAGDRAAAIAELDDLRVHVLRGVFR